MTAIGQIGVVFPGAAGPAGVLVASPVPVDGFGDAALGRARTAQLPRRSETGALMLMRVLRIVLAAMALLLLSVPVSADVVTIGSWQVAPAPAVHRSSDHTATLLGDGRVLVVGGLTPNPDESAQLLSRDAYVSAELFDPATGRWSTTGSLAVMRQYHTATLLSDGRVLVVGGYHLPRGASSGGPQEFIAAAEIYDPGTGRWTPTGSLALGRMGHSATLLKDGRVLVAGGVVVQASKDNPGRLAATDTAEVYDPATGRWTPAGKMPAGRWEHAATLLDDGTVLVTGGRDATGGHARSADGKTVVGVPALQDAVIFDPRAGTWTTVPHLMGSRRTAHTATLLADGTVLIAGGAADADHSGGGEPVAGAELYVPTTKTFIATQPMLRGRIAPTATRLPDGRVLLVGGYAARRYVSQGGTGAVETVASAEIYLPDTGGWVFAGGMVAAPDTGHEREQAILVFAGHHTATLLSGPSCGRWCGQVMVIGGDDAKAAAQVFAEPSAGTSSWLSRAIGHAALAAGGAGGAVLLALAAGLWRLRVRRRRHAW